MSTKIDTDDKSTFNCDDCVACKVEELVVKKNCKKGIGSETNSNEPETKRTKVQLDEPRNLYKPPGELQVESYMLARRSSEAALNVYPGGQGGDEAFGSIPETRGFMAWLSSLISSKSKPVASHYMVKERRNASRDPRKVCDAKFWFVHDIEDEAANNEPPTILDTSIDVPDEVPTRRMASYDPKKGKDFALFLAKSTEDVEESIGMPAQQEATNSQDMNSKLCKEAEMKDVEVGSMPPQQEGTKSLDQNSSLVKATRMSTFAICEPERLDEDQFWFVNGNQATETSNNHLMPLQLEMTELPVDPEKIKEPNFWFVNGTEDNNMMPFHLETTDSLCVNGSGFVEMIGLDVPHDAPESRLASYDGEKVNDIKSWLVNGGEAAEFSNDNVPSQLKSLDEKTDGPVNASTKST